MWARCLLELGTDLTYLLSHILALPSFSVGDENPSLVQSNCQYQLGNDDSCTLKIDRLP